VTTLHAACGTRNQSDDNGPALGVHEIGMRAHVAGAASDPSEVVGFFNFSCTDEIAEVDGGIVADNDAAIVTPDAGPPGSRGDGGTTSLPDASGDSGAGGCACTTTPRSSDRSGAVALLLAGVVVAARVRRKSRSQR
jgi:MYXO-CTERM domain-containing protein